MFLINRKIFVLRSIQKDGEKVNTMCYTPDINRLLNKDISM